MMKILTSGSRSGLGRFIHETLGGVGLTRSLTEKERQNIINDDYDAIIHCAINSKLEVNHANFYQYLDDNVFLTRELTSCRHRKFIYLSSVDVYPQNDEPHAETEVIEVDSLRGIYATTKLASEAIVQNHCKDFLILRPATLLGKYSRKNSVIKIIGDKKCKLGLSGESTYNFITHTDVTEFIKYAIEMGLQGIYNIASSNSMTLAEAAEMLNKKVQFGDHIYNVGNIQNQKIMSVFPAFLKTARESLVQFIEEKENE